MNESDPSGDAAPPTPALFRREGDYWTVAYEGRLVRLRDAKGLRYLDQLLRHPGRELDVADLGTRICDARRGLADPGDSERARKAVTNRIRQTIARIGELHPELGRHLLNSVHTGVRCAYTPERLVRWNDDGTE